MKLYRKGHDNKPQSSRATQRERDTERIEIKQNKSRHGKRDILAYANSKGSGEPAHLHNLSEPMLFTLVSGKPMGNFSQGTRHVVLLRGRACALKC